MLCHVVIKAGNLDEHFSANMTHEFLFSRMDFLVVTQGSPSRKQFLAESASESIHRVMTDQMQLQLIYVQEHHITVRARDVPFLQMDCPVVSGDLELALTPVPANSACGYRHAVLVSPVILHLWFRKWLRTFRTVEEFVHLQMHLKLRKSFELFFACATNAYTILLGMSVSRVLFHSLQGGDDFVTFVAAKYVLGTLFDDSEVE